MKRWFLLTLLLALPAEAIGACVCVTGIIFKFPSGAAICQCRRYETPDCVGGQCKFPTECSEYRPPGEARPETCPVCRPYRSLTSGPLRLQSAAQSATDQDLDRNEQPLEPVQIEGLPVAEDFDPIKAESVGPETTATSLGFFQLKSKDKIASNIDSDSTAPVRKDINVKIFRVKFSFNREPRYIAYECVRVTAPIKIIEAGSITSIRYNPNDGDRILMLKISDKALREAMGQNVYLLRGPN